ncbi:MAG: 4Fe-4S binding protein [Lachnospiraceae bacterium]|nr:4Fe-4S binding protein [Lachnospiraceae bacterium]
MGRRKAQPNQNLCVACGVCVHQCPREAIAIYKGCYAVVDSLKCIGCGLCQKACPADVITLVEEAEVYHGDK